MQVSRRPAWWLAGIFFAFAGCIEPFIPQLKSDPADICVVSGEITNLEGYQTVTLSKASSVSQPMKIPLTDCQVFIEDDKGNTYGLNEYKAGHYRVWVAGDRLSPGTAYRVRIVRPEGDEIRSDFDVMPSGPEIDTLYYLREQHMDLRSGITYQGLQFYGSFSGEDADSRYYHWSIEETYEYHSPYLIENYYDGTHHAINPPDNSLEVCWKTQTDPDVYNVSTKILSRNGIENMALHYVDNSTTRLYEEYSVLIGLHSISEPAYIYWEQMRTNSLMQQGSLYEHQPLPVEGNLHNLTHPENKVLGFFSAATLSQRRIFIAAIRDMGIFYDAWCNPTLLGPGGWRKFTRFDFPVYYKYFRDIGLRIIDGDCIDCRRYGGTTVKPDFWPY
jgi:hypothetical protein